MKKLSLLVCVLMLAGCESEVEKCAKAWMRDHAKTEAQARYICLKAQSGKE
jgi:Tfp pilus assembly protein PilP